MNSLQEAIADRPEAAYVERAARQRFKRPAHSALRGINCEFRHDRLFLNGHVPSYYYKQLAQEAVKDLAGVTQIINNVAVFSYARPGRARTI